MKNLAEALVLYSELREKIRGQIEKEFLFGGINLEEVEALFENHPDLLSISLRNCITRKKCHAKDRSDR